MVGRADVGGAGGYKFRNAPASQNSREEPAAARAHIQDPYRRNEVTGESGQSFGGL